MPRSLSLLTACALALVFCLPGRSQDSPSLGDLARQAQKDKSKAPAKKVFTNDDISSGSSTSTSGPVAERTAGRVQEGQPAPAEKQSASAATSDELGKLESLLDKVAAVDRATLVKNVLQGADPNFPGAAAWEDRLFAARDTYVAQGRALLQKGQQLISSAETLKGIQDPNDPRVKNLSSQLQQFVQDATRIGAAFEAVIMEGRDLAGQSSPH